MDQSSTVKSQPVPVPVRSSGTDWLSVAQFAFSLLALCIVWGIALLALLFAFLQITPTVGGSTEDSLSLLLSAASALTGGILVLPSVITSLRRLIGKPPGAPARFSTAGWPSLLILGLPVILLLGFLLARQGGVTLLFMPPLHVLAVLVPVVWILFLAVRGLPLGSRQRAWGVFDSGLVLGPAIILVAEIFALLFMALVGIFYITQTPGLLEDLTALAEELSTTMPSTEAVVELLAPYLTSPVTITAALVFVSLLVPLIEEALKPVGVWLLAGRKLTPAAGFAAGAMSGAGFAIFESLAATASSEGWTLLVVGRIGTAAIHIFTSALVGMAIATAWSQKRYLRLLGTYLGAVLLHGVWNSLSILYTFDGIYTDLDLADNFLLPGFITATPYILAGIAALVFIALLRTNRRLHRGLQVDIRPEDVL